MLLILFLAACAPGGIEPDSAETAVPTEEPNPDAAAYAEELGISQEEANERLALQDSIGALQAELLANEADSFAGLWLEHEPVYRVVVAFAGIDGQAVIRPYLETYPALADVVDIRSVQYTLAELEAAHQEAFDIVARLDPISIAGGVGGSTLAAPEMPEACPGPYWILGGIGTVAAQAIPDIYTQPVGSAIFYFQSKWAADEGSLSGMLAVEAGCFRVNGYTILWPPNVWPDEDSDPIQIVFRGNGIEADMFAVGDEITLPGGEKTAVDYRFFENKVNCPGPFWGVAAILPDQ